MAMRTGRSRRRMPAVNPACSGGSGGQSAPGAAGCGTSLPLAQPVPPFARVLPCLPQSNRRPPAPGAIRAAVPNTACGIAPSRRTARPGWRSRPTRARRRRRPMSNRLFAAISNAASSVVVWPGLCARRAATTSWWLSPAKADRFGSALNAHVHFHCCIFDGVVTPAPAADAAAGVVFHPVSGLAAAAVTKVQAQVRQRVLRACVRRGLLGQCAGDAMGGWDHGGGFSQPQYAVPQSTGGSSAGVRKRLLD